MRIEDGIDAATGLNIFISTGPTSRNRLNERHRRGRLRHQDVGARFYTYVSTLMLVMEACAEAEVDVVVLDPPTARSPWRPHAES